MEDLESSEPLPGKTADSNGCNGTKLLDDVATFLRRFVAYPSERHCQAATLWAAHTWLMDTWDSTPRIAFLSPEPASGKTRALETIALLVPRPVEAVNVSASYMFRKVASEDGRPTIMFDEIDTVFGPKAKENEDIRGLLNAGHRKGAVAGRCVVHGKKIVTEEIPAYCAVAVAGLGGLPDTILSRSVIVQMRRRAPHERIEPYRFKIHSAEGHLLRDRLAAWASGHSGHSHIPEMPSGINDRDADVWEPLLTVADLAGGHWPQTARVTAVTLVTASKEGTPSLGIRLLTDVKTAFGDADAMPTAKLLTALNVMEESPWGDLKGKALDSRSLANRLGKYGVKPTTIRDSEGIPSKGYKREDLHDVWQRYLPKQVADVPPNISVTAVTSVTSQPADLWEN